MVFKNRLNIACATTYKTKTGEQVKTSLFWGALAETSWPLTISPVPGTHPSGTDAPCCGGRDYQRCAVGLVFYIPSMSLMIISGQSLLLLKVQKPGSCLNE